MADEGMERPVRAAPANGATLQTVYHWMVDNNLGVVYTVLVSQHRQGKWES